MILMTIMIFQLYVSSWDVRGFTLEPYVVKKTFLVHELSSVDNDSDVDVKMGLEIASAGHEEVDHCTGDQLADTEKVSLYFSSLLKMNNEHDDPHNCYCQYQHHCHHKHCTNDTN